MRVLWFSGPCGYTPEHQPSTTRQGYNGGGWQRSVFNELKKQTDIELGVCFAMDGQPFKTVQGGIAYYPFPNHQKPWKDKLLDLWHYRRPERDEILWEHYKACFKRAIDDFQPDVIHIFGSELYQGLATFVAPCPVVLHLQGLLSLSIYIYFPSGVSPQSYLFQDWSPKKIYDRFQLYVYWQRSCHREKAIMRHTKHVIGRTHWDKMASEILNPERVYHYGGEILREEFYEEVPKRLLPDRLRIVTTSSSPMYKGFDYVMQTANVMKNVMGIDFEWLVYGNVDPTFHQKFTGLRYSDLNIQLCGVASAATLRNSILSATVYFQPSYIENSPNSVCEAQILGVPVVATNVGGTASIVDEGKTGFLVPTNDPYTAAYRLCQLSRDRDLNLQMGERARAIALKRHDRKTIVSELVETYHSLL